MILVDGKAQTSCMLPVSAVKGRAIITLEGVSKKEKMHPVQEAFVREQAAQCGYCLNGMVMSAIALLANDPHPDDSAIRQGLRLSLCRCGSHSRIIRAIKRAAGEPTK
jgi:nicotinate dehydrogenase subunit A